MHDHDQYRIAFVGLTPGTYTFEYDAGKAFFEEAGSDTILDGNVRITVTMIREERMLDLGFSIQGTITVPCDRCNDPVELKVDGQERLIVKFGDDYHEESEDVQVIPEAAGRFDLTPFLYEYISLLVPVRKVHPEDEHGNSLCDPVVIRKLEELSGHRETDPRWDALKKLKNDN